MSIATHQQWINEAIILATDNAAAGGGPFAALVVREGKVIGQGVNSVHLSHDPTEHAELLAIREACKHIQSSDLSDCVVYASGEPCPMCMGAIYWAKPKAVYYACSKSEAGAAFDFPDPLGNYYAEMSQSPEQRTIPLHKLDADQRLLPFRTWKELQR